MRQQMANAQKRAVQYWFVDGWAEIAAGLVGLLLAGMFWWWEALMTGPWSLMAVLGVGMLVSFGLRLAIHRIKERTTYPRTGYAAPASGAERKISTAVIVVFTLVLLAVNFYISSAGPQALLWSPAVAGLIFAFIFGWVAFTTGLRRLVLPAGVALAVGVAMPLLRFDYFRGVGLLAGAVGMALLVMGWRTHRDYEREHPVGNGGQIGG